MELGDPQDTARLRWRARRGLLENDLVLQRFFDQHGQDLTQSDVQGLSKLLDLSDNDLMDVLLCRKLPVELDAELDCDDVKAVLQKLQP